jgi:hypothetical protein
MLPRRPNAPALLAALALAASAPTAQVVARDPAPARPPRAVVAAPAALPPGCVARVFGGHNYFFCPGDMPFDAARGFCRSLGADLAVIDSRYENDALAEAVGALGRGRHLIGHHDRVTEGRFESVTGTPATFNAWAVGEPNNAGDEDCVELDGSTIWNDIPCGGSAPNVLCEESPSCTVEAFADHLYHVCRTPPAASPRAWCGALGAAVASVESPEEERFLADHARAVGVEVEGAGPVVGAGAAVCEMASACVRRYRDGRPYLFCVRPNTTALEARRQCERLGARLVVIEDAAEDAFVYAGFALFRRTRFYIDLRDDDVEGTFYSRLGPATFTRWSAGEPNNVGEEDCVELADGGWNDVPCAGDTKNAFVCEPDGG